MKNTYRKVRIFLLLKGFFVSKQVENKGKMLYNYYV